MKIRKLVTLLLAVILAGAFLAGCSKPVDNRLGWDGCMYTITNPQNLTEDFLPVGVPPIFSPE